MIKYLVAIAALVLAGVPAAAGLAGNSSFSREVPVRVPVQARTGTTKPPAAAVPTSRPTSVASPTSDHGTPDGTAHQSPGCCEAGSDSPTAGATSDDGTAGRGPTCCETGDDRGASSGEVSGGSGKGSGSGGSGSHGSDG